MEGVLPGVGQRTRAQWPVGCCGDTGVPGQGTCKRNKEGCSSHRSPAARGLMGAGSLIKHRSVIRICSPAQETRSGSDRCVLEPRRQTSGGCPVLGRSSGAPSAVLGLSGASPSGDKVWPGPHQAQVGTSSRPVGRPHGPGASGTRRNRSRNTSNH